MPVDADGVFSVFMEEVRRLERHELTPRRIERLLVAIGGGQRMYIPRILDAERLEHARRLLSLGYRRAEAARVLCDRWAVSKPTGYRIIKRALRQAAGERAGDARRGPATQVSRRDGAQRGEGPRAQP